MTPKALLDAAKAFLCWDVFPDLSIQLVPLQSAVAYYYPPGNGLHSIVLFYDPAQHDFSEPLFLLFHEAGHACQCHALQEKNLGGQFERLMALDTGPDKASFESEAWRLGKELFIKFAGRRNLGPGLLERFESYCRHCVQSYTH
jgi:hypothetical protein